MACKIEGCGSTVLARDMCRKHYLRVWKGTDPIHGKLGTVEDRFWRKVIKRGPDECWNLRGDQQRYGQVWLKDERRPIGAHVYSYTLHHGEVPAGMFVLHRCDNVRCVNPDHLFVGTPKQNMEDMDRKGRRKTGATRGVDSYKAILNERAVRFIKAHPEMPHTELGEKYGVVPNTIRAIRIGRSWAHIK